MIDMEEALEIRALELTPLEQLADNCPRCFGPILEPLDPHEAHYHVCLDGNLQHRRHEAASIETGTVVNNYPNIFVPQTSVNEWANRVKCGGNHAEDVRSLQMEQNSFVEF